jgi:hypothetical protein
LNQQETDIKNADVLRKDLPAGIDATMVNENRLGELQEQLAVLDQWENDLTEASTWATRRVTEADEQIALADVKFEEIERHVAAERAEAKRLRIAAVSDEKIATKKLRRITSAKIALLGLLRSMGANR